MEKIDFNELIVDITFLRDKADEPLIKVAYNMAMEVAKIHIEKWSKQVQDLKDGIDVGQEMYHDVRLEAGQWIKLTEGCEMPDYDEYVLWAFEGGVLLWQCLDKDGNDWLYGGEHEGLPFPPATHYRKIMTPAECDETFNIK